MGKYKRFNIRHKKKNNNNNKNKNYNLKEKKNWKKYIKLCKSREIPGFVAYRLIMWICCFLYFILIFFGLIKAGPGPSKLPSKYRPSDGRFVAVMQERSIFRKVLLIRVNLDLERKPSKFQASNNAMNCAQMDLINWLMSFRIEPVEFDKTVQ